jgi:hypothetical protein
MGRPLDEILAECLEAVAQGQRTVEDCLALYPESAEQLGPELRLALQLRQTYSGSEASADFQATARERFLSAVQARGAAPRPAGRLLTAPAALLSRLRALLPAPVSLSRAHWRPTLAAVTLSFIVGFLGFSSFVVASSGDSLPGDWRYPVKRLTERARLTFTIGDDARRDYRITLAEERLNEVQKMASQERDIGPSVLKQLTDATEPLVQALEPDSVPPHQIERITDLTAKQQDVLGQVAPLVEEGATDELEQAMVVSTEGHEKAVQALAQAVSNSQGQGPNGEATPGAVETPSATPGAEGSPAASATPSSAALAESSPTGTPSAMATPTPESQASEVPAPTSTPGAPVEGTPAPTPETTPIPTPTPVHERVPLLDDTTGGITWSLLTIGDFSVRVPAPEEKVWVVSELARGQGREVILVGHRWGNRFDAVVTVSVPAGDASVGVLVNGTLLTVSPEEATKLAPALSEIILHIVDSATAGS